MSACYGKSRTHYTGSEDKCPKKSNTKSNYFFNARNFRNYVTVRNFLESGLYHDTKYTSKEMVVISDYVSDFDFQLMES